MSEENGELVLVRVPLKRVREIAKLLRLHQGIPAVYVVDFVLTEYLDILKAKANGVKKP